MFVERISRNYSKLYKSKKWKALLAKGFRHLKKLL